MFNLLLGTNFPLFVSGFASLAKEILVEKVVIQTADSFAKVETEMFKGETQLLVLDLDIIPKDQSIKFINFIGSFSSVKIIILYQNMDQPLFKQLYLNGVLGILAKSASVEDIGACITKVCQGEVYIENHLLVSFISTPRQMKNELTPKEKIVANLLADGRSNSEICTALNLHASTVSTFRRNIFLKLQVSNPLDLEKLRDTNK